MTSPKLEITLASKWGSPENRKREAVRAAHDHDVQSLLDLLNYYMTLKSFKRSQTSDETRRKYGLAVRRFLEYADPSNNPHGVRLEITRLDGDDIDLWIVSLDRENLKPNAIALYLNGLRALYRALIWAKATDRNPAGEVRPPRDPTPAHARKSALSPSVYRDLIALPATRYGAEDSRQARDVLLLALGGSGGLRAKEIVGLDVSDLEMALKRLTVRSGKGGKKRIVPLSRTLLEHCARWLEVRRGLVLRGDILEGELALIVSASSNQSGGKRLTTDGARYIANGYYKLMGLPTELWGLHTLRRTAGTHLYRATRDLHVVADVLGHASVNTSAIYAKMDMEVRREALEAMEDLRDED